MNAMSETAIRPIINSLIVSIVGTIIAMVAGVLAAYGISRFKVGGSLPFSLLQLRMFPPIAIIIPIMIMWAFLHMIDKWYGLVIIYGVVTLPFATWLMKTFFDDIPNELNEAAVVDGCSNMGAFLKVVFPLARGGIASTGLFVFILNWSDFLIALVLTDRRWTTIPVHISKLQSALVGQLYGPKAALGVIAAVPPIVPGNSHPEVPGPRIDVRRNKEITGVTHGAHRPGKPGQEVWKPNGGEGAEPRDQGPGVRLHSRPLGLRKNDDHEHDLRAPEARFGQHLLRRAADDRRSPRERGAWGSCSRITPYSPT